MWPFSRDASRRPYRTVDVHEAAQLLDEGVPLIDVREPDEFRHAHVPTAHNAPLKSVARVAARYDKDQRLLLICASGHRSADAARSLGKDGFSQLLNVRGGTAAWRRHHLPLER